jgi:hypothetical protein
MPNKQPPEFDIAFVDGDDDKHILPPSHALKRKVGHGGFDPKAIAAAEKRLFDAKAMFPQIATSDIDAIDVALKQLEHAPDRKEWIERIQWAAMELRSNGTMFQYPLVTAVAESLYLFVARIRKMTDLKKQVIQLHHNALHIAMGHGPRDVLPSDEAELLNGLRKAAEKALQSNV